MNDAPENDQVAENPTGIEKLDAKYTLKQAAQLALDLHAQGASNLSGVVHTFSDVMKTLWVEARHLHEGADFVNSHAITILFVIKLNSLCGLGTADPAAFSRAFDICTGLAAAGDHVRLPRHRDL